MAAVLLGCKSCNARILSCIRMFASKMTVGGGSSPLSATKRSKIKLPVETDPEKLVTYVCGSNIYKEGQDIKLKDDSEYPDWIWKINLEKKKELEDLDPNTLEYWELLHHISVVRQNRIRKLQRLPRMRVNYTEKIEKLKALRFRALAGFHYDPGENV